MSVRVRELRIVALFLAGVSGSQLAEGLIVEPSYEEYAQKYESVVAVGRVAKLQLLQASDDVSYELVHFELRKVLKKHPDIMSGPNDLRYVDDERKLFCVIRLFKSPVSQFREQKLVVGRDYLLVLKHVGSDGLFAFHSNYQQIPEANERNVEKMKEAVEEAEQKRREARRREMEEGTGEPAKGGSPEAR